MRVGALAVVVAILYGLLWLGIETREIPDGPWPDQRTIPAELLR